MMTLLKQTVILCLLYARPIIVNHLFFFVLLIITHNNIICMFPYLQLIESEVKMFITIHLKFVRLEEKLNENISSSTV